MPLFKATIDILLDAKSEPQALDALAETLRPLLKEPSQNPADAPLLDWDYTPHGFPTPHDGSGFEYIGSAAETVRPAELPRDCPSQITPQPDHKSPTAA